MPRDSLRHDEWDAIQREHEMDLLVQLAGRRASLALDPEDRANEGYFEWLSRRVRTQLTPDKRQALKERANEFADRMSARISAMDVPMLRLSGSPVLERQRDPARLSRSIEHAARRRMVPWIEPAVAAGAGREIWEEPCDTWIALPDGVASGKYVALPVSGDSMDPLFHAGDRLLVRLGELCRAGDVIVARHVDHGYVVKRVGRLGRMTIELLSFNASYRPMRVRHSDLNIMGTVILRWCSHGSGE